MIATSLVDVLAKATASRIPPDKKENSMDNGNKADKLRETFTGAEIEEMRSRMRAGEYASVVAGDFRTSASIVRRLAVGVSAPVPGASYRVSTKPTAYRVSHPVPEPRPIPGQESREAKRRRRQAEAAEAKRAKGKWNAAPGYEVADPPSCPGTGSMGIHKFENGACLVCGEPDQEY